MRARVLYGPGSGNETVGPGNAEPPKLIGQILRVPEASAGTKGSLGEDVRMALAGQEFP